MEVKKVGVESIQMIQSLAQNSWAIAYKNILSAAQMSYTLNLIYSRESLQNQIDEKGHQFILVTEEEKTVGFASYGPSGETQSGIYKLHKIYIDPHLQGRGTGKLLLDHIIAEIKLLGAHSLELNVNRKNKSIGFYQKYGFEIIDELDIPIGEGYFMNDYIMRLTW